MSTKIAVVLNPNARGQKRAMAERARRLERVLGWRGDVFATRTLEELSEAVAEIMKDPPPGARDRRR